MSLNCYYHPKREANTECENCGKSICVLCKMVFHKYERIGTRQYKRHEYCPICFYDKSIKKISVHAILIALGFTTFFSVILILIIFPLGEMLSSKYGISFLFPIIISVLPIIGANIYAFIYVPIKIKGFKTKKKRFLKSINRSAIIKEV